MNTDPDLPGFAVCRHPNQVLKTYDDQGYSLNLKIVSNISEFRYLAFLEKAEIYGLAAQDIFKEHLSNDSKSVASLALSSRGQYAGSATPSLVSKPQKNLGKTFVILFNKGGREGFELSLCQNIGGCI